MPSYARKHQLANSLVYHAFNRSNARIRIFHSVDDYQYFMSLLKDYSSRFFLKIYHWVIMDNHYHLLFEIDAPERVSGLLAGLGRAYTYYHHKQYQTSGFLWQGRFKLQPVQKEKYLIACGRYIERNPVRRGSVLAPYEYPYSSGRFYCSGYKDGITCENPLYESFGLEPISRQEKYQEFLRDFDLEEEKAFKDLEVPRGDKEFLNRLIKENGRYLPMRRGKPRRSINYITPGLTID